ncbi:hypothetical protein G7Z17_g11421 [Cylindrodendrum hubeiense]|uniref:SAC3/GANP/THP3 conserved domain-containing protein n=1 Tax=Cylindrodendrum hubeiense TaxID=595255 RepID=A0A9P5L6D9_9HYPO|nr:hypothetical protein G7Z17_g11421 [Cylindrodendrum hubeiense]
MARGKWIDKKSAQHFTLVHRPQNDPLIHDENAPSMVLNPVQPTDGPSKGKHLDDLASDLGYDADNIRSNEGEAAGHGIYYDDSEYDYMQHMRDLNSGGGEVVFIESTDAADKGKGKQKESLSDALKKMDLEQKSGEILDEEILPSKNLTRVTYEAQQNIPDAIKGFQPDMDPRLREVLEALEDDAYVEDNDDIFNELAKDGRELDDYEFEEQEYFEDDQGWESDDTAKPTKEYKDDVVPELVKATGEQPEDGPSQDWMEDFKQFKKESKGGRPVVGASPSELQSNWTTTTNGGRRKKRKGALTNASSYSMTSSSLVRTEQMTFLDARFDKIEEAYNEDFADDMESVSAISTASSVQGPVRSDFDGIMDEFLGGFTKPGKRTSKKMRPQTGLEQLDEIRQGLGPARIRGRISQMFSAFGQPTRSPSPAFNPFANNPDGATSSFGLDSAGDASWAKQNNRSSQLANQGDNTGKRKANNPFQQDKDVNLSDGGNKGKNGDERKKKNADSKKNRANGVDPSKKTLPQNARGNGLNLFAATRTQGSRPTSSSSADLDDNPVPEPYHSNDPHARKVYEQLRKDAINPPQWPSQPGNPKNKAEVTKFREKYEAYRDKVRASLTKAGLIDDPEKRKTLQDAISFKGICEDMCPEYEKITRINEMDVHLPEKNPRTTYPNTQRMVKKLARSAAGQEAPLPMDVRSIRALRRTLDYLIDDLLQNDGNLPVLHSFLWDRTRAIRRDFTFFSSLDPEEMKTQVYVLENITRFHVTALHLLSQEGKAPQDFVEQQELEQLGKALLSLRDLYDDCNEQGVACGNEAEFRAYYLIFHAFDPNIIETLQRQWKPNLWRDSDEVRTAVSLVEALQNTQHFHGPLKDAPSLAASAAFHTYFRIVEDPKVSYTMACFAELHFPHLRRSILTAVKKALARPRESSKDVTTTVLNKFLRFDTFQQAIDFAELHDFEFGECEENPSDLGRQYLILDNRKPLPHHRLQHHFSQNLVEKKRGSRALPDLIHQSVMEDPNAPKHEPNGSVEESLFVSNAEKSTTQASISAGATSTGASTTTPSPFASFGPPAGGLGSNGALNHNLGTKSNGLLPTSGSAFQQAPSQPTPFPPPTTLGANKPVINPFASAQPQTTPSILNGTPANTTFNAQGQSGASNGAVLSPFATSFAPASKPAAKSPFALDSTGTQPATPGGLSAFSAQPQTATPIGQQSETKSSTAQAIPSTATEPLKTPGINLIPPTPKSASSAFSFPPTGSGPLTSGILGNTAPPASTGFQPSLGTSLGKPSPTPPTVGKSPAVSTPLPALGTTSSPKPAFPFPGTSSLPPAATPSILGLNSTTAPASSHVQKPASPPPPPPLPPRDLMGDFTKWYVKGDDGLMEDFQGFMLDNILQSVFRKFQKEEEKKRQQEEEEQAIAEANKFRVYSLSVKYFYRWREIARELRLSQLRRSGRDQMRSYHEAQRAAQLKAQKDAARRAARERAELAELNRPEEFMDMLKHKRPSKRQAEDALLASGVLSGVSNEQAAVARIVERAPSVISSVTSNQSKLSRSSTVKSGSKTQALREQLLGDRSASFRRSLPPMSSGGAGSSDPGTRVSKVSERWRLKAMGIVQMPDGTALPESLANDVRYGKKRYSGIGSMGPPTSGVVRRASIADLTRPDEQRSRAGSREYVNHRTTETAATKNKRKRPTEDNGDGTEKATSKANSHKRVMSDAQNLISELRAMREEMEEGASWFKDQNERLQSENVSRGSTPWDQSI